MHGGIFMMLVFFFQAILTKGTIQIQITENFENTDKSKHLKGQFGLPVVSKSVSHTF